MQILKKGRCVLTHTGPWNYHGTVIVGCQPLNSSRFLSSSSGIAFSKAA